MKTDLFQSYVHSWVFQICWHIECSTLTASSFRIWNSSVRIPSLPLTLFIVMLPKAHLTLHCKYLALDEWSHHHGYLDHENLFCTVLLCFLVTSSCIFCFCQVHTISVLYCAHFFLKSSLTIFNFLEETSSLSHPTSHNHHFPKKLSDLAESSAFWWPKFQTKWKVK